MGYRSQPGYYRTSPQGNVHWVSGSEQYVDTPDPYERLIERFPEIQSTGGASFRYLSPNANCPMCGKPVFFYQNERGSRVYFDELGPPWPKHPCLVTDDSVAGDDVKPRSVSPMPRSIGDILDIHDGLKHQKTGLEELFAERYGYRPWALAKVARRFIFKGRPLLELETISLGVPNQIYVTRAVFPECCQEGLLVAVNCDRISFCDEIDFKEIQLEVEIVRKDNELEWALILQDASWLLED